MVERLAQWSQCYKTGEGRYNQGKFEKDFWYNVKLEVTRSKFSPEVLFKVTRSRLSLEVLINEF